MSDENRVFILETTVAHLMDEVSALRAEIKTLREVVENTKPLVYGSKKSWDEVQRSFLVAKYNETNDINKLCEMHNEEFGPKGYVERTPTAIACQLYKLIDKAILPQKIVVLAEKYMK